MVGLARLDRHFTDIETSLLDFGFDFWRIVGQRAGVGLQLPFQFGFFCVDHFYLALWFHSLLCAAVLKIIIFMLVFFFNYTGLVPI